MSFFFRLNKELNQRNITFKILNIGNKIPEFGALVLTTRDEVTLYNLTNFKTQILAYDKNESFDKFLIRFIAAYRIGYKDSYSELTFSIDPGIKHIGLAVFLDDYFLISHTIYDKKDLIKKLKKYIGFLQNNEQSLLKLIFKFGRGVVPITLKWISQIFTIPKYREITQVFLIDEAKSSKIKLCDNFGKKIPKNEASALILALRDGIEVNNTNYTKIFNQIKSKKLKINTIKKENFDNNNELKLNLREIAEKVLKNELSLSESIQIIRGIKKPKS
ncbi:MAG: hypothetical protein ACFFDN_09910 [Candidatus Hodarchaeota archaeon]